MSLSVFLGLQGPPGWPLVSFSNLFLTLGAFQGVLKAFLESSWASSGPQGHFQGRLGGCFQVLE